MSKVKNIVSIMLHCVSWVIFQHCYGKMKLAQYAMKHTRCISLCIDMLIQFNSIQIYTPQLL